MDFLSKSFKAHREDYKFRILQSSSDSGDSDCQEEAHVLLNENLTTRTVSRISNSWTYLSFANFIVLGITITLVITSHGQRYASKNAYLRKVSWWSPILDDIDIPSYETTINGTFFAKPEVSIAREEPGPENDADWEQFERVLTHVVTREEIIKLGKDPETVARFADDYWGLGEDAYMVQLDVMHQIHCVNMLRKAAFSDYPGYTASGKKDDGHDERMKWIHLGHCVDILLQTLQCNANTEVLTLAWVEGRKSPWPDFSINRKCRDFNTIRKWQVENSVDEEKFDQMPVPKEAFVWPAPWKKQDTELGEELGQHHKQEGHLQAHSSSHGQ